MESNREAAEQCLQKAMGALKQGDVEKAKRMTAKSLRLFETEKAKIFLEVNKHFPEHFSMYCSNWPISKNQVKLHPNQKLKMCDKEQSQKKKFKKNTLRIRLMQ